jgi:hypothetical protein
VIRPRERLLRRDIPKDAIRNALEGWSDRLAGWEQFFTAILVAGLVVEYLPGIARFLPTVIFAAIRPHAFILRDFGGFLVIAGVVGEMWIGFRASSTTVL